MLSKYVRNTAAKVHAAATDEAVGVLKEKALGKILEMGGKLATQDSETLRETVQEDGGLINQFVKGAAGPLLKGVVGVGAISAPPAAAKEVFEEATKDALNALRQTVGCRDESEAVLVNFLFGLTYVKQDPTLLEKLTCQTESDGKVKRRKYLTFRYGYPGTRGNMWKNMLEYYANHMDIISVFCAHRLNPIKRWQRGSILLLQLIISLFFATLTVTLSNRYKYWTGMGVAMMNQPINQILKPLATMEICEKNNCCVQNAHGCGDISFLIIVLPLLVGLGSGAALNLRKINTDQNWQSHFVGQIILSFVGGVLKTCFLESFNWYVQDWDKVLFPLFQVFLNKALNPLCDNMTFHKSRQIFQETYSKDCTDISEYIELTVKKS